MMFRRKVVLPAEMFPSTQIDTRCLALWPRSATMSCAVRAGGPCEKAGKVCFRRGQSGQWREGKGPGLTFASCLRRSATEVRYSIILSVLESRSMYAWRVRWQAG